MYHHGSKDHPERPELERSERIETDHELYQYPDKIGADEDVHGQEGRLPLEHRGSKARKRLEVHGDLRAEQKDDRIKPESHQTGNGSALALLRRCSTDD